MDHYIAKVVVEMLAKLLDDAGTTNEYDHLFHPEWDKYMVPTDFGTFTVKIEHYGS